MSEWNVSDDFLTRAKMLNYDYERGVGNYGQSTVGTSANNSSIFTQASELETRYKSEIKIAAQMDPINGTRKVMNEFLNEALDLMFSSLNSHKSAAEKASAKTSQTTTSITSAAKTQAAAQTTPSSSSEAEETVVDETTTTGATVDKSEIEKIHDKLKSNDAFSAKDALNDLKKLEDSLGKDTTLADVYGKKESAKLAVDLYIKAQEEGVLEEALEVLPATQSVQKQLSGHIGKNSETAEISRLIEAMDSVVMKKTKNNHENFGLSESRAKELEALVKKNPKIAGSRDPMAHVTAALPNLLYNDYTDNEKMYLLTVLIDSSNTQKSGATAKDFVEAFRGKVGYDEQEKYFSVIMDLYAKFSAQEGGIKQEEKAPVEKLNSQEVDARLKDDSLSVKEKAELVKNYKGSEQGYNDRSTAKEGALFKQIHEQLKVEDGISAADTIAILKDIKDMAKVNKEEILFTISDSWQGRATTAEFAIDLYIKAQKEGVLDEALEILPPTKSVQEHLSFGAETKEISRLIQAMNINVVEKTDNKAKNYGIDESKVEKLNGEVFKSRKTGDVVRKVFEKANDSEEYKYSDSERMFMLNTLYESKPDGIEDFVDGFRSDLSYADQEEYFKEIMKLYASFSV